MPLYDGGAISARQKQSAFQQHAYISQRRDEMRKLNSDIKNLTSEFDELAARHSQLEEKLISQKERRDSLATLADRADVNPLELVTLFADIAETEVSIAHISFNQEILHMRMLHYADGLLTLFGLPAGDKNC